MFNKIIIEGENVGLESFVVKDLLIRLSEVRDNSSNGSKYSRYFSVYVPHCREVILQIQQY